jgi:P4 family phage/plasmid primase-like protien
MEELKKFLARRRCDKGGGYTHTSIANPAGSYAVPLEDSAEFIQLYKRAMVSGTPLHLTERPTPLSPMRTDLDFRFALPTTAPAINTHHTRLYLPEDVERIVRSYFQIMVKYLDAPPEKLYAVVMEKPNPVEYRTKLKDGLHIMWPELIVDTAFQHWIRHQIIQNAQTVFAGLPFTNAPDDIVDRAIIDRNNWQMYGSTKPDAPPYRITRYYVYDAAEDTLIDRSKDMLTPEYELCCAERLSVRVPAETPATPLVPTATEAIQEYIKLVHPTIDTKRKTKLISEIFGKSAIVGKNHTNREELDLAKTLVKRCLNQTRSDNYEDWIKLGWVLHNIDDDLLETWLEFSSFSSKYNETECRKLWNMMRNDTLGMGTLRWWAKKDNEAEYERILSENVMVLVDTCIGSDGAHFDVARVVHALYKDAYRFVGKDCWFVYRPEKHRWTRSREGLQLRLLLSNEIVRKFMERSIYWGNQALLDPEERERYKERSDKLSKITTKLKTSNYKDGVMKECKSLFTDEQFEELLDSKPHLIGFENGVYDLRMHEFREGLPDDYISFTTSRIYQEYDPTSEEALGLEAFFQSVFTNPDVRSYVKDILTSVLDGGIRQERFYVFTGNGCHALDTPILMADGSIRKVQDIQVGEQLMGDDQTPRTVQCLFRGRDTMVCIRPTACPDEPFVVNTNHILSLQTAPIVLPVASAPALAPDFRVVWIQSGTVCERSGFESSEAATDFAKTLSYLPTHLDIPVHTVLSWEPALLQQGLVKLYKCGALAFHHSPKSPLPEDPYVIGQELALGHRAAIPNEYKTASFQSRRRLLQGFQSVPPPPPPIAFSSRALQDIRFITRSIGADSISTSTFQMELRPTDDFYGFELDGNHRYVMGDFTITHNSNGKSKILELVQKAIGDYYCILPIALLTQKRTASNSAQSELERTKGRRFAIMQEPGESEKLNTGLMKELSGGDRILVRGLFKEPIEFRPQFKMILTCNELPEVQSDDGGTWRRIRVINFTSKFVERPNPAVKTEFPIDMELSEKFDLWANQFVGMLIHHHKNFDPKKMTEPVEVRIATEGYKKNNDVIGQYVSERIRIDEKNTKRTLLNRVYNDFRQWVQQFQQKGKRLPDRNQFRAYVEKTHGEYPADGRGWRYIRLVGDETNDSDAEE